MFRWGHVNKEKVLYCLSIRRFHGRKTISKQTKQIECLREDFFSPKISDLTSHADADEIESYSFWRSNEECQNKLTGLLLLNTSGEVRLHARFKNKLWSQQRRACIATTSQPNNQLWFTARALWWLFNNSPVNTYLYINLQYGTTADLGNVFLQENHLIVLVLTRCVFAEVQLCKNLACI